MPSHGQDHAAALRRLRAIRDKEATYPELVGTNRYGKLTVLACEMGGRWHHTACRAVSRLVEHKTQSVPPLLRRAARLAYHRRWWSLLSTALQRTATTNLLDHPRLGEMPGSGPAPCLSEVLQDTGSFPEFSRLPLRG